MPKPSKPEIEQAVAGQKAKASTYNENMQSMLDYVDNCMDYAVLADLSNLNATGEAHFVKPNVAVTHTTNTAVGSSSTPVYINSSGKAVACSSINSSLLSAFGTITQSYTSGSSGYIVFSTGFIIQWGRCIRLSGISTYTVDLIKEFTNTNYTVVTTPESLNGSIDVGGIQYQQWLIPAHEKTVSTFKTKILGNIQWIAIGY